MAEVFQDTTNPVKTYEGNSNRRGVKSGEETKPAWLGFLWNRIDNDGAKDVLLDFEATRKKVGLEPTADCLRPHEIEGLIDGVLAHERLHHAETCRYCEELVAGLAPATLLSEVPATTVRRLLDRRKPEAERPLVSLFPMHHEYSESRQQVNAVTTLASTTSVAAAAFGAPASLAALPLLALKLTDILSERLGQSIGSMQSNVAAEAMSSMLHSLFSSSQEATEALRATNVDLANALQAAIRERPILPKEELSLCDEAFSYLEVSSPDMAASCRDRYVSVRQASLAAIGSTNLLEQGSAVSHVLS